MSPSPLAVLSPPEPALSQASSLHFDSIAALPILSLGILRK